MLMLAHRPCIQLLLLFFFKENNINNYVQQSQDIIARLDLCLTLSQIALATCNLWASFQVTIWR
jgi:hypothetical protein